MRSAFARTVFAFCTLFAYCECEPFAATDSSSTDGGTGGDGDTYAADGGSLVARDGSAPLVSPCTRSDAKVVFCQDFDAPGLTGPTFGFTDAADKPGALYTLMPTTTGSALRVNVSMSAQDPSSWLRANLTPTGNAVYDTQFDMRITNVRRNYVVYAAYSVYDGTNGKAYFFGLANYGQAPMVLDEMTEHDNTSVQPHGEWQHVQIVLTHTEGRVASTVTVDGTVVAHRSSDVGVLYNIDFRIGAFFMSADAGDGPIEVGYDNVVISKS